MKKYILIFICLIYAELAISQRQRLTYEVKSVELKGEQGHSNIGNADTIKAQPETKQLAKMVGEGRWTSIRRFFPTEQSYESFIQSLSYDGTINTMRPIKVLSTNGNELVLQDALSKEQMILTSNVNQNGEIEQINLTTSFSNFRLEDNGALNYVRLPEGINDKLDYFTTITDAFQYNPKLNYSSNELMFGQIDFADLSIKLNYCYDIPFFGKSCGDKTYNYGLGPVLSGKDMADLTPEEQEEAFVDIADITAFSSAFTDGGGQKADYLPHDYVLTAVIADVAAKSLVFFREGLEPWDYTGENELGYEVFAAPIAVKVLNQVIYVLDKGNQWGKEPAIHLVKINHTTNGNFSVSYLGKLATGNLILNTPTDVGGFLGDGGLDPHKLLVTDANGLHIIPINTTSGFMDGGSVIKTISQLQDPYYIGDYYSLANAKRVDGDKNAGTTIIIVRDEEVIAVSNASLLSAAVDIKCDYRKTLYGSYNFTNLAYMNREKVWCLTDNSGKLHKLDQYGRYMGGNGQSGKNETNGELYFPVGLTPNPIADPSNPYRYRFIVANRWGIETGMKLFAPIYAFPELKVFENLTDGKLTVAFTSSGMWQAVEGVRSVKFDGFYLNGSPIAASLWNTVINAAEQTDYNSENTNYMMGVPNMAEFDPSVLVGLKRGWNKMKVQATLKKVLKGNNVTEAVFKEIDFYWLPTTFSTTGVTSQILDDYTLNKDGGNADFIYKTTTMQGKGLFYVNEGTVTIGKLGVLNVENGCTFYSKFHQQQALSNFSFDAAGKVNVKLGGYICIQTGTDQHTVYSLPNLTPNFALDEKYILGTNPTLPSIPSNACESPCQFLAYKNPKISFKPSVVLPTVTGGTIKVNVTDVFTTYCEKHKWEILLNGVVVASKEIKGTPIATELSALIPYIFQSCSDYDVRLSIGCNDINFITGATVRITTRPYVDAGIEERICETKFPYTLSGFQPLAPNGIGTGLGQAKWTANSTNFSTTTAGVVNITSSTPRDIALKLTYTYKDLMNCLVISEKTLFVSTVPAKPVLAIQKVPCEGEDVEIRATNNQNGKYVWTGPNGFSYQWYSGYLKLEKTAKPTMDGTYSAYVTRNGCQGLTGTVNLTINPLPTITIPEPTKHLCVWGSKYYPTATVVLPVVWKDQVGVTPTGNNLSKTGGTSNVWDAAAYSTLPIRNDGYVEATASEKTTNRMLGLSNTNINIGFDSLRYAIFLTNTGIVAIYEKGKNKNVTGVSYNTNDILRIAVVGNSVKYYKNGTAFYTSTQVPVFPLYPDVSLYTAGATLMNVNMATDGTGTWAGQNIRLGSPNQYYFDPFGQPTKDYPITYTYTATSTGCQRSAVQTLVVGPKVESNMTEKVCINSAAFPFEATPAGGTWYEYDLESQVYGNFNPAERGVGTHQFTYQYTDAYNCSGQVQKNIQVKPTPTTTIYPYHPQGSLRYAYYEKLTTTPWAAMPNFGALTPMAEGASSTVDVSPKQREANYGLVYEGFLIIPTTGSYTFYLSAIDGAKLHIDNSLAINNDGTHSTLYSTSTTKTLAAGQHPIKVEYFNTTGTGQLGLQWSGPGIAKQTIPGASFASPITFCEGSTVELSGYSGLGDQSYLWSNGATTETTNVSEGGDYTVTIKNAYGCTSTGIPVSVKKLKAPDATILTSNGVKYSYYENGGTAWSALPDFTTLTPKKTGHSAGINLLWREKDKDIGFVFEGYISIGTTGDYTFFLYTDGGSQLYINDVLVVQNAASFHDAIGTNGVVTLRTGLHKIKVLYANASTAINFVVSYQGPSISKVTIPATILYNSLSYCQVNPFNLGLPFNKAYSWSTTASTPTIPYTSTATYGVEVTGANGCRWGSDKYVAPTTTPTVSIVSSTPNYICSTGFSSAVLIASPTSNAPFKYVWKKNGTTIANATAQSYTATTGGIYTVTVTDACGLVSAASDPFEVVIPPTVTLSTDIVGAVEMCANGGNAKINVTIDNYSALKNYDITFNPGNVVKALNADANLTAQPLVQFPITKPGTYSVIIKDKTGANTCTPTTKSIMIASKPNPTVFAAVSPNMVCNTTSPILLSGGSPIGGSWSSYTGGSGVTKSGSDYYFTPSIAPIGNTLLVYTYTAPNGCAKTAATAINVTDVVPTISSLGSDIIVDKNIPVNLNVVSNLPITWSTGAVGSSITYTPTSTATITATVSNACGTLVEDIILIDPCTFTGYKTNPGATVTTPVLGGLVQGGGVFNGVYYVSSDLTLHNGIFTFQPGTILLMGTNVKMNIGDPNATFAKTVVKMDGVSINSSCDNVWGRIVVNEGQSLLINQDNILQRSTIEDADVAIYVNMNQASNLTEFKISNIDFLNNYISIIYAASANYTLGNRFILKNCSFDSSPLGFKKPYIKTTTGSYYSDYHIRMDNSVDYSLLTIEECTLKNARIGILFQPGTSFKPTVFFNTTFQNCYQHAIYGYCSENSTTGYLENVNVEFPSMVIGTSNINSTNNVVGIYARKMYEGIRKSTLSCSVPVAQQTNQTVGINFDDPFDRTGLTYDFSNNIYLNLYNGIVKSTRVASVHRDNNFTNCTIGLLNNSGFSYLDCNTFNGNTQNYSGNANILRNQGCGNLRSEEELQVLQYETNHSSVFFVSHSSQKEAEVIQYLFSLTKEERQLKLKEIKKAIESVSEESDKWEAMTRYIELQDNPATIIHVKGITALGYSKEDSLKLQWLANSDNQYAYDACIQLHLAYPFAPCNKNEITTKISNETFKDFHLGQNVPNPATNETIIPLYIPSKQGKIVLELRNVEAGTLVRTVPVSSSGEVNIKISLDNISAGVYFYTLVVDGKKLATRKMVVVK